MPASQKPISWTVILVTLVVASLVTGLAVGALGYLVALPQWLPSAVLGCVVGVVAAFLIWRRHVQITDVDRP
jgi:uncharacterized membrane protein YccC